MILCPSCRAPNPDSFQFCGRCGKPLKEQEPEQKPQEGGAVPSWLRDLGEGLDAGPGPAMRPGVLPAEAEPLSWGGDEPAPPAEGLPSWMSGEPLAPGEPASLPWMDRGTPEPAAPEKKAPGLPDWLAGGPPPAAAAPQEPGLPPWLADEEPAPAAPQEPGLPPWLADETPAEPGPAAPARMEEGLPPWLADELPAESTAAADLPPWLAGEAPAEAPPPVAAPAADEGLPPWLAGAAPAEPPAEAAATVEKEGLPPWLAGEAPAEPLPAAAAEEEGLPAWLAGAVVPEEAEPAPAEEASWFGELDEEMPAWLSAQTPETPAEAVPLPLAAAPPPPIAEQGPPVEAEAAAAGPPEEIPPWLEAALPVEAPADEAEIPPWLEAALPAETPADEAETLAWLESVLPAEAEAPAAEVEPPVAEAEPPPWLEMEPVAAAAPEGPPAPLEYLQAAPVLPEELEGLPEWAQALRPEEETPPAPPKAPAPARAETRPVPTPFFEGLDLPEWLQVEEKPAAVPEEAPARELAWLEKLLGEEATGDELPFAEVAAKIPRAAPPPLSPARQQATQLLSSLLAMPEPAAEPRPLRMPSAPQKLLQWFGSRWPMLLLAVVVTVLVWGDVTFPLVPRPLSEDTAKAITEIERGLVDRGAVVLVAYDWDVQRGAEMQPLALAVTSHLIRREARIIAVSTVPQGGQLAHDVFRLALEENQVLKARQVYNYGDDYVNLGLRTGAESALRLLVDQPLWATFPRDFQEGRLSANLGLLQEASTLDDVDLLVVITGEEDRAIAWLEQVRSRYRDKPCLLVLPAELGPMIQPYIAARSIAPAVLQGFPAAVEYVAWLDRNEGLKLYTDLPLERRQNIVAMASMVLVGVILAGNLVELAAWLLRLRREPRRR